MAVTSMRSNSADTFVAVGSESGVVNIYSHAASSPGPDTVPPNPRRAVMNLTTPVETMRYSPDGQMLAIASK